MPLKAGSSQQTIAANIGELRGTYKQKGKIGNVKPRSKEHARKISVAIAMKKAGKSNTY